MQGPAENQRQVDVRLVRAGEGEHAFEVEFWGKLTPEERLHATWQATLDWAAMRGMHESQLGLQRHLVRIERR